MKPGILTALEILFGSKRETRQEKEMTVLENGLNVGDRATGLGLSIKGLACFLPLKDQK